MNPYVLATHSPTGLQRAVAHRVYAAIRTLMVGVVGDAILHAEVVGAGAFKFRWAFAKDMGPSFRNNRANCDHLADIVFRFFEVQWRQRHPGVTPAMFLNGVQPVTPPTEAEIDDAWEIEIASDEASMKKHYEGSARTRKGKDLGGKRFD